MKKIFALILLIVLVNACSNYIDTISLTPEQHLEYAVSLYNDEDYIESKKEFESILIQYPGNAVNDDARYYLGMTYFNSDQFLLAAYEFSKLINDIPASPFVPDAQFMLAESYYQLSPAYQLDQRYTEKAVEEFQAFIDFFPLNAKVEEAENKIKEMNYKLAQKAYQQATIYEKMEYYTAALMYFQSVIDTYHDTEFAPLAIEKRVDILIMKERIQEAVKDIDLFLANYPDHPDAEKMQRLQFELIGEVDG